MMNRYITALLVVLTATGIEAQAYQSALRTVKGGDVALEELCRQSAFQGKEAEILHVIKTIKEVQERDEQQLAYSSWRLQDEWADGCGMDSAKLSFLGDGVVPLLADALTTSIQIRAPSF